jgi:SLT domain-containing protein
MKGKIALLIGGAAGYVLGTKAGRERYEQIKAQAESFWSNPKVQERATKAQDFAKQKAPVVKHKAADVAASATASAKDKVGGDSHDQSAAYPTSASTGTSTGAGTSTGTGTGTI